MAHAKASDLEDIDEILDLLRELPIIEKSLGCFYKKGKGVLHFHIKAERRFAHVFDGNEWQEVDIKFTLSSRQKNLVYKNICKILAL